MDGLAQLHGILAGQCLWSCVGVIVIALALGYLGAPFFFWAVLINGALLLLGAPITIFWAVLAVSLVFLIKPVRASLVSSLVMKTFSALKIMPKISETERAALDAGVVWSEAELFS